jgi:hypothetical protein
MLVSEGKDVILRAPERMASVNNDTGRILLEIAFVCLAAGATLAWVCGLGWASYRLINMLF